MTNPSVSRPRRALALLAAVLVALLLAGGVYLRLRATSGADAAAASADTGTAAPTSATSAFASDIAIPVEGVAAVRDTLVLGVSAAGEAAAWRRAVISAQVGGRIASVAVRENDAVGAGRLLVALDPAEYQLAVEEAEAALRDAEAKYRELTLLDEEIADAQTRQERARIARARSGLDQAEVRLKKARLDLERTRFTAPFAGRVASVQVVPGQWVRPGDELLRVVDLDPIKVEVQVLESEVGLLAAGRAARVELAAFPGERFAGRVETINPLVESGTRTAKVTVLVPNPAGRVLPGMYARVALDAHRYPDRVLVPRAALLERDRRSMLFVYEAGSGADGGRAKWRYVTPGLANDSLVEIVAGTQTDSIRPGEVVLTGGHYTLVHDARVRVVENAGAVGGRPD